MGDLQGASEVYKKYFDGKSTLYPRDIDQSVHMRIVAKEYMHPKIEQPPGDPGTSFLSKLADGLASPDYKKNQQARKDQAKEDAERNKKVLALQRKVATSPFKGNLFSFYTYVPGSMQDNTDATWGSYETDLKRGMFKKAAEADVFGISKFLGGGDTVMKMSMWMGGKALIPADSMIFQEAGRPTLDFTIHFAPKSAKEAEEVVKTLKNFRNGTRPSLHESGWFFDYPPVYQITICPPNSGTRKINKNLFMKYPPMYLKSCNITYSSSTPITTFFKDGMPTEVEMQLSFEALLVAYNGSTYGEGGIFGYGSEDVDR